MKSEIKSLLTAILFFGIMTLLAYSLTAQVVTVHQPITREMERAYINPFYEQINTLEDCIEWLDQDMHNSTIPVDIGSMYILNLQEVIAVLKRRQQWRTNNTSI